MCYASFSVLIAQQLRFVIAPPTKIRITPKSEHHPDRQRPQPPASPTSPRYISIITVSLSISITTMTKLEPTSFQHHMHQSPHLPLPPIRSQFPALQSSNIIYMDNAGGSAVLSRVAQKVATYLLHSNVQLGASYKTSKESVRLIKEGVEASRVFMNAEFEDEVCMGSSTTQLLENLARAMEGGLNGDEEIIVTNTDHEANIGCFVRMAERNNLKVKIWKANPTTLELDLQDLQNLLTQQTHLVAFTHCSNILGSINNVESITSLIHSTTPTAKVVVDGVAYAPHRPIDVQKWGVDYYVFSWYKVYAPHISCLYMRRSASAQLQSLAHFFIDKNERPYIFQPGNLNYELTASLGGVLEYLKEVGEGTVGAVEERGGGVVKRGEIEKAFEKIAEHETSILKPFMEYLVSKPEVYRIIGRPYAGYDRVPTVSFVVVKPGGLKSREVVEKMDLEGFGIRFGHFVTHRLVVGSLGLDENDGVIRVSMVHYNSSAEVSRLIECLDKIVCA
ncbi:hypothetical protein HDV05_007168 [Chytridiales sp. JEL 0842]|nr:hypothetical protein HDV05_007168 [Chytridiales sp. JEL 0842]